MEGFRSGFRAAAGKSSVIPSMSSGPFDCLVRHQPLEEVCRALIWPIVQDKVTLRPAKRTSTSSTMASAAMSLKGVPSSTVSRQASVIHRQLTASLGGQRLQTQRPRSHSTVGKKHVCSVCCSHHAQGRVCAAAAATTTTKNIDDFTGANERFKDIFSHGHLPAPPRRKVAIVTCMDARIHPEKILGLAIGDAHVIRNAGGRVSGDALRSLVISQRALGTEEVIVIHHTKCGKC